jgi:acyl-CoA thioesterase-1
MTIKKIIFIICLQFITGFCLAETQPLFQPNQTDTLWYTWAEYDQQNTEVYCNIWNSSSWGKSNQITNNTKNNLAPAVAIDINKNPWIVWSGWDGVNTSIYSRYYDGHTWSNTIQVDDIDIYYDGTPSITIDKNNTPWVVWAGNNGREDNIYVSHWNGKNWSTPVMINTENNTPDVMPVLSFDNKEKLIVVWCGFDTDRYKLFFSEKINNVWTNEKLVIQNSDRFSVNMPNILKKENGMFDLTWYEKNIGYKSSWDGTNWSSPTPYEVTLPEGFLKGLAVGSASISWIENGIYQSIKIIAPSLKNVIPAKQQIVQLRSNKQYTWLNDFICATADAAIENNKYIAFGDSITYGYGASDLIPGYPNGYPPRLELLLNEQIAPSIVLNEGNPGETTFGGIGRIDEILNKDNARFLLLMEGTNDINLSYSTETIIFNLGWMVERATAFGTTTLLASISPYRGDNLDDRVKNDVNPAITQLAKDKNVTFVDQYTELATNKDAYIMDRLHPNDNGYAIMANTWFDAIKTILNPPEQKKDQGCGAVPPIYRSNNKNNNLFANLIPLFLLAIALLIKRRFA